MCRGPGRQSAVYAWRGCVLYVKVAWRLRRVYMLVYAFVCFCAGADVVHGCRNVASFLFRLLLHHPCALFTREVLPKCLGEPCMHIYGVIHFSCAHATMVRQMSEGMVARYKARAMVVMLRTNKT